MGEYRDFAERVYKNSGKSDPEAYCASIKRSVEGKDPEVKSVFKFYTKPFSWIETKSSDGTEMFATEGYISTIDEDLIGDIVTPECHKSMLKQLKERVIKCDIEHESWVGKNQDEMEAAKTRIPAGKIVAGTVDENGTFVKTVINNDYKKFDDKGNVVLTSSEVKNMIKNGFLDAFSIAYIPTKFRDVERAGKKNRMLDDVVLLNVAYTGNPINTRASNMATVMAKSLEYLTLIPAKSGHVDKPEGNMEEQTESETQENTTPEPAPAEPAPAPAPVEPAPAEPTVSIKSLEARVLALEKAKTEKGDEEDEDEDKKKESEKKSEVESLRKEVADLKALLNAPQYKSIQETMKNELAKMEGKATDGTQSGPLSHIR